MTDQDLNLELQLRKEIKQLQRDLIIEKETSWDVLGKAEKERQRPLKENRQLRKKVEKV